MHAESDMLRLFFLKNRNLEEMYKVRSTLMYTCLNNVWIISIMPDVGITTWMRFTPVGL